MSKSESFRLALQHGDWGYFGIVELEVEVLAGVRGLTVEIPDDVSEWRAGILFGVSYVYERSIALRGERRGVRVRVIRAIGHAVDTTEIVMAFVSAQAFWRALDEPPAGGFSLDAARGIFSFPK